ncbi:MAG TPA: sugar phosphate isomerase/epimerase [Candidatus Limnocylindria bacterium]|nr:sugar phosphate isomerase/epimerase [Candidatus Limnocylindria bacterium]
MNVKTLFLFGLSATTAAFIGSATAEPIPDQYKQNGFAIGAQAYSFNRYTVFEAIEKTAETGGKVIEFFPGQKLSKEEANVAWNHNSSDETIAKVQAKLKEHGIKAVNYGVVGGKDEAEWRKIFEFGKKLGLYGITTEDATKLDMIEPLVKEFDIKVGIHDHPRRKDNPNYRVWDPNYILEVTKDRDARIGACADTGHWQSSGLNPVWCLRVLKGRVISSHMKDKTDFGNKQWTGKDEHDVPYGTGVGEIGRCLDELKKQNFEGNISIEYEYNWTASVPDIKKCVEFVKQHKGEGK